MNNEINVVKTWFKFPKTQDRLLIKRVTKPLVFLFFLLSDDNEGSSSDTAPLFQMAGDGRSTDDVTLPLLFLFHKEGNILLEALKEHREVEVLLSEKARDRGETRGAPTLQK